MPRILVIDDNQDICLVLSALLSKNKYEVRTAHTGEEGLSLLQTTTFDLVLSDYTLPNLSGAELLQRIKTLCPQVAIIVITGYSDVNTAVEAFRYGASDFITKPLYPDELLVTIREVLAKNKLAPETYQEIPSIGADNDTRPHLIPSGTKFIIGISTASQQVQRNIELIAPSDMVVLISGETGTGKEFVAQSIHKFSKRCTKPFVTIDCGTLSSSSSDSERFENVKGTYTSAEVEKQENFEVANGGTLFLDEIGNLSNEYQVKLLSLLEERKVKKMESAKETLMDIRIIAATHQNLSLAVKEGRLREDLYHRLNEFKIHLTPLRERKEDVLFFADHFLKAANESLTKHVKLFSEGMKQNLTNYSWPGNLRELNNVIRRAVLLTTGDVVEVENLPSEILETHLTSRIGAPAPKHEKSSMLKSITWTAERQALVDVLEKVAYDKSRAAELLNIDTKTLNHKLKLYSIDE